MHLRIHFLLLVVLLGYSSTSYAQQAGVGKAGVASTAAAVSDSPAVGSEAAESESDHQAALWRTKDDIYIDDNTDDDEDDDEDDWEEGSGVRPSSRNRGNQQGSRRGGGGGSGRNRDDLEASGSGAGPVRGRGGAHNIIDEEDEDIDQGSGAPPPDVRVPPPKKPEDKSKKPSYTLKEPKEEVKKKVPEVGTPPEVGSDFDEDPHKGTDKEIAVLPEEEGGDSVFMNKAEDRATSFFSQPGILAAVIGGAVVGLLCAILVVMFIVYRMRKKDEGSYALDEPKRSPTVNSYTKNSNREFYA